MKELLDSGESLESLQRSQAFLLEQVVKIPEENQRIEREIQVKSITLQEIQDQVEELQAVSQQLYDYQQEKAHIDLATPLLDASLSNIQDELTYINQEVESKENESAGYERVVRELSAQLERSSIYYRDILHNLRIDTPIEKINLKQLKNWLKDTVNELKDVVSLRNKAHQLSQDYLEKKRQYEVWIKEISDKRNDLLYTFESIQRERLDLQKKHEEAKRLSENLKEKVAYHQKKLRYFTQLPELDQLKLDLNYMEGNGKGKPKKFNSGSIAFTNFGNIKPDKAEQSKEEIRYLKDRKVDLSEKLNQLNQQIKSLKESRYVINSR